MMTSWFILFLSVAVSALKTLTPEDLVQLDKTGSPIVSPSGHLIAFTSSKYSTETSSSKTTLYVYNLDSSEQMPITTHSSSQPVWLSDTVLAFLSRDVNHDVQQIWYTCLPLNKSGDFQISPLTNVPVSINTFKFEPQTSTLVFSAQVYEDGSLEKAAELDKEAKENPASGIIYDSLMVRHWDTYLNPKKFEQLFSLPVQLNESHPYIPDGMKPINLLRGTRLETPVAPFGGSSDYALSSEYVALSARVPKHSAAWNTNLDIYLVPLDGSGPPTSISQSNLGADSSPVFDASGNFLVWLQMRTPQYESDHSKIVLYRMGSGEKMLIAKNWDRSPKSLAFFDSNSLLVNAEDQGKLKLFQVNLVTHKVKERISEKSVQAFEVAQGGNTIVLLYNSMLFPSTIFSACTKTWALSQRTFFNDDALDGVALSKPSEFWFKGALGDQVHGWILPPVDFDTNKTYPLAMLIHGGPEGAWGDDWSFRWNPQMWTSKGYFVVTINFHGSTGYGRDFKKAILKHWGEAPYIDIMKGLDYILDEYSQQIDSERICALGASYGGYMINWINGHTKRFKCLVNHDGMFNTIASYFGTEELWFPESEFGGPAFSNDKSFSVYNKMNPAAFAHRWRTPTLVIHGERDYRLPVTEGLSTFTALQRQKVPSRLLYFPDENHWVLKPANWILWQKEIFRWLDEFIGSYPGNVTTMSDGMGERHVPFLVVQG